MSSSGRFEDFHFFNSFDESLLGFSIYGLCCLLAFDVSYVT